MSLRELLKDKEALITTIETSVTEQLHKKGIEVFFVHFEFDEFDCPYYVYTFNPDRVHLSRYFYMQGEFPDYCYDDWSSESTQEDIIEDLCNSIMHRHKIEVKYHAEK